MTRQGMEPMRPGREGKEEHKGKIDYGSLLTNT